MTKVVELSQFEELLHWLEKSPGRVLPFIEQAMGSAVRAVQENIVEYPPATSANQPGRVRTVTLKRKSGNVQVQRPMGYYERGRGWWYPVLQTRSLGQLIGVPYGSEPAGRAAKRHKLESTPVLAGYKLADGGTSEMLGRSWATNTRVDKENLVVVGEIGNNASYSMVVQGPREKQSSRMNSIGWTSVDVALERSEESINNAFSAALQDFLSTLP